jgi:hypothetical protein
MGSAMAKKKEFPRPKLEVIRPTKPAAPPDKAKEFAKAGAKLEVVQAVRPSSPQAPPKEVHVTAEELAKKQREISVSEFFAKNRHLLGFDSPRKALLTAVKEAVDNSLDACEEAKILPEIEVRIEVAGNGTKPPPSQADRFIVTDHVGGYLKIAPEHTEAGPLSKMMKPGMGAYDRFRQMFEAASKAAGKKQYLIPYFIAAHPGTTDEDMVNLALWLKAHDFRLDQVQTFLPTPMALATAMYHTERNPLKKVLGGKAEKVDVVREGRRRRIHKALLRYHDPDNWPLLREALKTMGREDLIGNGRKHLIPLYQPAGTGKQPEGARAPRTSTHPTKPTAAKPAAARPAPAKPAAGKPRSKPAPASDGRPHQVPKHPLSQRRGGGKAR